MVKDITTVAFNSLEVEKRVSSDHSNNILFRIDTPPIIIKQKGILKVSNFCHMGGYPAHTDNMYLFRIRGIMADTSRFITGNGGDPLILTTTFNNNRSLYDENIITLVKQTINSIEILVDTYTPNANINKDLYIYNPGSNYLIGQIIRLNIASTNYEYRISNINATGGITSYSAYNIVTNQEIPPSTESFSTAVAATVTGYINGSGAILAAVLTTGAISSITITNGGLGYKAGQTLAFSGGGGSGANIVINSVNLTTGAIINFAIVNGGSGYSSPPAVSVNATTHTPSVNFSFRYGQILREQIPTSLNFSITFIIEQDEF
jgi:hypothetical protein